MDRLAELLNKHYSLDVGRIEKLPKNSTSQAYVVYADEKKYFLKELFHVRGVFDDNIEIQFEIIEHLAANGLSTIGNVKTIEGKNFFKDKGVRYILYPYFDITGADTSDDTHLELAAEQLALFHKVGETFKTEHEFLNEPMHKKIDDITSFSEMRDNFSRESILAIAKKSRHPLAKRVLTDAPMIMSAIVKVLKRLWSASYTKESLLHYDFNGDNLFFVDGNFFAISDFEHSHIGYLETDIAKAGKYWSENKEDASIDVRRFKRFVHLYDRINTCSKDWKLYHALLIYVALRRLIYAADRTMNNADLTFLYDYDIRMIRFLMENEKEF
ncbi:MAG: phosphotransferase [Nanoarchaeota archaeon]|nr:phosphotransferase [Nanoarchaeota archaeon]